MRSRADPRPAPEAAAWSEACCPHHPEPIFSAAPCRTHPPWIGIRSCEEFDVSRTRGSDEGAAGPTLWVRPSAAESGRKWPGGLFSRARRFISRASTRSTSLEDQAHCAPMSETAGPSTAADKAESAVAILVVLAVAVITTLDLLDVIAVSDRDPSVVLGCRVC